MAKNTIRIERYEGGLPMKESLKVLLLNGSPHANGNTAVALREMEKVYK